MPPGDGSSPARTAAGPRAAANEGTIEEALAALGALVGLDRLGIASADPAPRADFLRDWWARGYGGEMDYIGRRLEERIDPRRVLPGACSLIVGALWLPAPDAHTASVSSTPPDAHTASVSSTPPDAHTASVSSTPPDAHTASSSDGPPAGRVARYAVGDDYHEVLLERMRMVEAALPVLAGRPVASRSYVDTGPVLERAAAARAGLGWIGKNTCLIDPELGSHLMLGVILCDLPLAPAAEEPDHCGTCRACLDVCPTDAFPEPYVLDATRCLSYTTIEVRGAIPEPLREAHADHVFGCDLCQTVCPWNRSRPRAEPPDPLGLRARLAARPAWRRPTLAWLLALDASTFAEATRRSPLRRAGWRGLMRNALVAAGNSGDAALRPAVERHATGDDALLAEHARWALARLDERTRGDADGG